MNLANKDINGIKEGEKELKEINSLTTKNSKKVIVKMPAKNPVATKAKKK